MYSMGKNKRFSGMMRIFDPSWIMFSGTLKKNGSRSGRKRSFMR
jgi:hypothetical protein